MNNVQAISQRGSYQVAPKLPAIKLPPQQSTLGPASGLGMGQGQPAPAGNDILTKLMNAIKSQESNGNYQATNPSGADGGFQILASNFVNPGGWDKEALGRDITEQEFMNSPSIQDTIARFKLGEYLKQYGAEGAAAAWYGGPGSVSHMHDKTQQPGGYPSFYDYIQSVLSKM